MSAETSWVPGLVVLALALIAGAALLLLTRRRNARTQERDDQLADLELRAQLLIQQLKELEAERHHLPPAQYASERARLEALAAAAYRARDELQQAPAGRPPAPPPPQAGRAAAAARGGLLADHPQLKGALWGGGVVLFFVVLGLLLSREQRPRTEDGSITGRAPPSATVEQGHEETFQQAYLAVRDDPASKLDASARVVHELIRRQEWDEASRLTERALGGDPFHVEHRVHRALLSARQRELKEAIAQLRQLSRLHPGAHEALLFVGALAMQQGDERLALDSFVEFAAVAPPEDQLPQLQDAIDDLRRRLEGAPAQKR